MIAGAFPCLGEPLKLSAQRSKSVGSGPLWHSSGPFWTTLWHKELNQPLRNSSKLVPERIDPAIPVPIWMLGRWSNYISASSSVVDSGQDAGSIADARELHVVVKALARRDQGPAKRFSPASCFLENIYRIFAVKIDYVENETGPEPDVGVGRPCPPSSDHVKIGCGVMQSVAADARRNQRDLCAGPQRKDRNTGRSIRESSA